MDAHMVASLAPILRKPASAEGLTCRAARRPPLRKSGSSDVLPCHRTVCAPPVFQLPSGLPSSPPGAAWRALRASLIDAFECSSEISADHPAAASIARLEVEAIVRDLLEHQRWVEGTYTRTTVLKGDGFEAMLLCWPPNVGSPVHAHSDATSGEKSNCFMAVLQGGLTETVYPPSEIERDMVVGPGQARALDAGATAYINDDYGVHKVANESATVPAVSLHIYAPGWDAVQLYREELRDAGGAAIDADGWGDF